MMMIDDVVAVVTGIMLWRNDNLRSHGRLFVSGETVFSSRSLYGDRSTRWVVKTMEASPAVSYTMPTLRDGELAELPSAGPRSTSPE